MFLKVVFVFFLCIGATIFTTDYLAPWASRQYKLWLVRQQLKKMMKDKPPEVQMELKKLKDGLLDIMNRDNF